MKYTLSLFVCLAALWLLLSGHYTPLLLGLGAASCAGVALLASRMRAVDAQTQPLHLAWSLPGYWLWLTGAVARANLDVILRILRPGLPISPAMVRLDARQMSELGQVIYANSITLTPGSVAVDLRDGYIEVHALSRATARNLQAGDMARRVRAVERDPRTIRSEGS